MKYEFVQRENPSRGGGDNDDLGFCHTKSGVCVCTLCHVVSLRVKHWKSLHLHPWCVTFAQPPLSTGEFKNAHRSFSLSKVLLTPKLRS